MYSNLPEFLPFKAGEDGESLFFDSKLKKAIQNVAWNNNPDFLNLKQEVESMKSLIHNFINSPENVENVEASLDRKTLSTMVKFFLMFFIFRYRMLYKNIPLMESVCLTTPWLVLEPKLFRH